MSVAAECLCSRGHRSGRWSRGPPQGSKPLHSKDLEASHPLQGPRSTYPKSPKTEDDDDDVDNVGQEHKGVDVGGRSVLGVQNVMEETPQGLVKALGPVDGQPQRAQSRAYLPAPTPLPRPAGPLTGTDRSSAVGAQPPSSSPEPSVFLECDEASSPRLLPFLPLPPRARPLWVRTSSEVPVSPPGTGVQQADLTPLCGQHRKLPRHQ